MAIGRGEPHRLSARDNAVFASVGAADAHAGPVVSRTLPIKTIDVQNPPSIGRPVGAEVEMLRLRGNTDAVRSIPIACPDLITLRAGQMISHASAVRAEAQA